MDDEDDGMGGWLSDGGIISPYPFQPAPIGGTAVSGPQHQPQMRQMDRFVRYGRKNQLVFLCHSALLYFLFFEFCGSHFLNVVHLIIAF